jgi:hypothetical protein
VPTVEASYKFALDAPDPWPHRFASDGARFLQGTESNQRANEDQDSAAQQFSVLTDPSAKSTSKLETHEAHRHTDNGDDECCECERDMVGTEREPDDEIVDAERRSHDDQVPDATSVWLGAGLMVGATLSLRGNDAIETCQGENHAADHVGVTAEDVRKRTTDQQADNRHPALEDAKDDRNLDPELGVESGKSDPYRGCKVIETDRDRDEQDREHTMTVVAASRN